MNRNFRIASIFCAGIALGASAICFVSFDKIDKNDNAVEVKPDGRLQYKWFLPETPTAMTFASEKVPLDRPEIKEQLDREMLVYSYGHSTMLYVLRNSTRYFPMIEQKLKENGVPDDFKYVCAAESSLQNSTSKVGAVGFWQFMKDTGPHYGLEINDEVDERYNVEKSTDAACKYFKEAYTKLGSWTAAAASYNCGMGKYGDLGQFQNSDDYYEILLPEETMRYMFRIIALKYIMTNTEKVGFNIQKSEQYRPYKTKPIVIDATVPDLSAFAISKGSTYRELKTYNPWLRDHKLTVRPGKTYTVQLPQ